jgi:hypothetical protein
MVHAPKQFSGASVRPIEALLWVSSPACPGGLRKIADLPHHWYAAWSMVARKNSPSRSSRSIPKYHPAPAFTGTGVGCYDLRCIVYHRF